MTTVLPQASAVLLGGVVLRSPPRSYSSIVVVVQNSQQVQYTVRIIVLHAAISSAVVRQEESLWGPACLLPAPALSWLRAARYCLFVFLLARSWW